MRTGSLSGVYGLVPTAVLTRMGGFLGIDNKGGTQVVAIGASSLASPLGLVILGGSVILLALVVVWRRSGTHGDSTDYGRETIASFRRSRARLEAELDRVRRYDHSLAVMVVTVPSGDGRTRVEVPASANGSDLHRVVSLHVGAILHDCLRRSDVPTWDVEHNRYVVLLPEADEAQAMQAANRVRRLVPEQIGARVSTGIAEFPRDGLTLEEVVEQASARSRTELETATSPDRVKGDVGERNPIDQARPA